MSMYSEMEREEQYLCDQLNSGEIDQIQFNEEMRELQSGYRAQAEEAAETAYADAMGDWF